MAELGDHFGTLANHIRDLKDRVNVLESILSKVLKNWPDYKNPQLSALNTIHTPQYVHTVKITEKDDQNGTWTGKVQTLDTNGSLKNSTISTEDVVGMSPSGNLPGVGSVIACHYAADEKDTVSGPNYIRISGGGSGADHALVKLTNTMPAAEEGDPREPGESASYTLIEGEVSGNIFNWSLVEIPAGVYCDVESGDNRIVAAYC